MTKKGFLGVKKKMKINLIDMSVFYRKISQNKVEGCKPSTLLGILQIILS